MSEEFWLIYGKRKQRYRARKVICKICKKELLVLKTKPHCGYCQSCNAKRVNPPIKCTELFLIEKNGIRKRARKIICKVCGKMLLIPKNQKHCGLCQSCNAKKRCKENHIHGLTGARQKALKYYPHICFCCVQRNDEILTHHIDGNRKNNEIENLLILCRSCHIAIHWRLRKGLSIHEAFEDVKQKKKFYPGLWGKKLCSKLYKRKKIMKNKVMDKRNKNFPKFIEELEKKCNFKGEGKNMTLECDHDHKRCKEILQKYERIDIEATIKYFKKNDGHCDCEILFNVV